MQESEKIKRFWTWFESKAIPYTFLNEVDADEKERLLNELLDELHAYCEELFYEIGGHPDEEDIELVITAEGNKQHFEKVEKLIDGAPKIKNWTFTKFRQAHGPGFVTEYEGVKFDPDKIVFIPLENQEEPSLVGFNVCYPELNDKNHNLYLGATYVMLDTLLGEKSAACDIDYFEIINTPENLSDFEFGHLSEIAEFIKSRKPRLD